MRWWLVLVVGCGRIGFDSGGDGGAAHGDGSLTSMIDAPTGCGADSFCNSACPFDPDCASVCGDGTCVANVGETCVACASDCKTTQPICGNLACDPGENGSNCPTDCGPDPWPWAADETALVNAINAARTGGVACPGANIATAPAWTVDPSMTRAARDIGWETAQYGTVAFNRCDGQSVLGWLAAVPANSSRIQGGVATAQQRVDAWIADSAGCSNLVSTSYTTIGVAVVTGAKATEYVVFVALGGVNLRRSRARSDCAWARLRSRRGS